MLPFNYLNHGQTLLWHVYYVTLMRHNMVPHCAMNKKKEEISHDIFAHKKYIFDTFTPFQKIFSGSVSSINHTSAAETAVYLHSLLKRCCSLRHHHLVWETEAIIITIELLHEQEKIIHRFVTLRRL